MNINDIISQNDQDKLRRKMDLEYTAAYNYTKDWKTSVANVREEYLVPKPTQDKVKVKKILNLMKMKRSVFKTDDETVINVPQNWQNGAELAGNTDKVFESNFKTMSLRVKKGKAQDDDTLYGVWSLAVDWWNDYSQEPIVSYVDSRLTFPDPSNSEWSEMRFFWTLLKKTIYELEADDAYDAKRVQKVRMWRNEELDQIDRDNGNDEWDVGDDLVSIYNHITIFKLDWDKEYYKCLTTWDASRTELLRFVKMQPLTDMEKADPSKITLWVTLYRGIPIPGQYNWASAIDEEWPYQDLETLITNLQIEQALRSVVGGKTILDGELWIDENNYASMEPWDVIIANRAPWSQTTASNGIFKEPQEQTSPVVDNVLSRLDRLWQEATLQNALVQWQSLGWAQTKAEVQTIQQNTNQILSGIASEYMDSSINLWTDIYRSYAVNMSSQRTKEITLVWTKGNADSYGFKKKEFISKWELYILIKSKSQENIQNKKDFAILLSLDASMSWFLAPDSTEFKMWKRTLLDKSGVKWLNGTDFIWLTQDERIAYSQLELLNNNEGVSKPKPWEAHEVYINIFKNGIPTEARDKAIGQRESILEATPKAPPLPQEPQKWGWWGWIWASLIASDNAKWGWEPSLADIEV